MYTVLTFNCLLQGVTFCGDSKASSLTMKNVPWHEEVSVILYRLQYNMKNVPWHEEVSVILYSII